MRETVYEDQREFRNIHTHRNLGIPNRAIQKKILSRHIDVTKYIRIGVTGVFPTTWDRKVEPFFFWGSYWKDSTLKASSSACRTRIIFHRLVDYLSVSSTYQMRNRVWPNTESTTCCPKTLLRNLHGIKTVSYLNNKNFDNSNISDRLWDLEGERTNLRWRVSLEWSVVIRSDAREEDLFQKKITSNMGSNRSSKDGTKRAERIEMRRLFGYVSRRSVRRIKK